ncbi:hypothetical protein LINGRAHAP2_LOCUS28672 [Linum grandiflorum]
MADIREMEAFCMPSRHMQTVVSNKYKVEHNMRQIYNYRMKLRKERLKDLSPTQWILKTAQDLYYFVQCLFDDEKHLSNIFLFRKECTYFSGLFLYGRKFDRQSESSSLSVGIYFKN